MMILVFYFGKDGYGFGLGSDCLCVPFQHLRGVVMSGDIVHSSRELLVGDAAKHHFRPECD